MSKKRERGASFNEDEEEEEEKPNLPRQSRRRRISLEPAWLPEKLLSPADCEALIYLLNRHLDVWTLPHCTTLPFHPHFTLSRVSDKRPFLHLALLLHPKSPSFHLSPQSDGDQDEVVLMEEKEQESSKKWRQADLLLEMKQFPDLRECLTVWSKGVLRLMELRHSQLDPETFARKMVLSDGSTIRSQRPRGYRDPPPPATTPVLVWVSQLDPSGFLQVLQRDCFPDQTPDPLEILLNQAHSLFLCSSSSSSRCDDSTS